MVLEQAPKQDPQKPSFAAAIKEKPASSDEPKSAMSEVLEFLAEYNLEEVANVFNKIRAELRTAAALPFSPDNRVLRRRRFHTVSHARSRLTLKRDLQIGAWNADSISTKIEELREFLVLQARRTLTRTDLVVVLLLR